MAEMFTEGYLKEVWFAPQKKMSVKVVIDPAPPFAIEYKEKRFILLASKTMEKNDGKVGSSVLYGTEATWEVTEKGVVKWLDLLISIKMSHVKCRFGINGQTITRIQVM